MGTKLEKRSCITEQLFWAMIITFSILFLVNYSVKMATVIARKNSINKIKEIIEEVKSEEQDNTNIKESDD